MRVLVGGRRAGIEWLVVTTDDGGWHVRMRQREDGEVVAYEWQSFHTHVEAMVALDALFTEADALAAEWR